MENWIALKLKALHRRFLWLCTAFTFPKQKHLLPACCARALPAALPRLAPYAPTTHLHARAPAYMMAGDTALLCMYHSWCVCWYFIMSLILCSA